MTRMISTGCYVIIALSWVTMAAHAAGAEEGVLRVQGDGYEEIVVQYNDLESGVLLIDRSGSMDTIRAATGNSRCEDALAMAHEKIDKFFDPSEIGGQRVAIWTFHHDFVEPLHSGYLTSAASAHGYVDRLDPTGCAGRTPLAEAMCRAVDGDPGPVLIGTPGTRSALSPLPGYLAVLTDGGENNSSVCDGPSGEVGTAGTWQNQVFVKMLGNVRLVDTMYWVADTVLQSLGKAPGAWHDVETGAATKSIAPSAACAGPYQCESWLFSYIERYIGGTYGVVRDSDDDYPCGHGQCPPPKPPGDTGLPPEW